MPFNETEDDAEKWMGCTPHEKATVIQQKVDSDPSNEDAQQPRELEHDEGEIYVAEKRPFVISGYDKVVKI